MPVQPKVLLTTGRKALRQTKAKRYSKAAGAIVLGVMQIPELLTQRKFVSAAWHAHFNAHKPPKTVVHTVLMLEYKF